VSSAQRFTRRQFVSTAAVGTAALLGAPAIVTARKTEGETIVGSGEHKFRAHHQWAQLPDKFTWQTTHNVAVDKAGNLYVIHEGREDQKDHPSIFVFDPEGKYVRSFGSQFQGGGHGIEVRQEGSDEFLYVCAYQQVKSFAKLGLDGEVVWEKHAPMKSGVYAEGEAEHPEKVWGRDRFLPTNFAFLDDGGFLLADGYGSFHIHRFDKDANWVSSFGGPGEGKGTFDTPHGIWIDRRPGRDQAIVICDRAHHTLQFFDLDGKYLETVEGFGLPANADSQGELLLIPELLGRVTLLNGKNEVAAVLGDDADRVKADSKFAIRGDEKLWQPGRFVHPHDACFDAQGNIYVAEWVNSGRVTKLEKLS